LFNQKGQASSVFQLLIAAIVAVVILTILMGVLGGIGGIGQNSPKDEAKNALKNASSSLGTPITKTVTFSKADGVVSARTISETSEAGIPPENICLSKGYYETGGLFDGPSAGGEFGKALSYLGSSNLKVNLIGICDDGAHIANDVDGTTFKSIKANWFSNCAAIASLRQDETFCMIAVKSFT